MTLFKQVTIIGVGLVGGSLARVCKNRGLAGRVVGYGRSRENLEKARKLGVIDVAATDLRAAVEKADLVALCAPVGTFPALVREMLPALKKNCVLTDAGSVKSRVVREAEKILGARAALFVGGHPIAGGEKTGVAASRENLFDGARCILTPTPRTDGKALRRVAALWKGAGARVSVMDMDEHDYIYGAVSHLPHVIAYALINTVAGLKTANHGEILSFSGNGLKDATRIAASEPVMWRDICLANRKPILQFIGRFQTTLETIKTGIEDESGAALGAAFAAANKNRAALMDADAGAKAPARKLKAGA